MAQFKCRCFYLKGGAADERAVDVGCFILYVHIISIIMEEGVVAVEG